MFIREIFESSRQALTKSTVVEATGLNKRVRIVKGSAAGKTGTVGEVRHGQYVGAPKTFTVDIDGGGSIQLPKEALRLIKSASVTESVIEDGNPQDAVTLDVPLLIRLLEYAREDAQSDMDLHTVAERLIELSSSSACLTMRQYEQIVGDMQEARDPYRAPRKGSVAFNAAAQRKKQDNSPESIKRTEKVGTQNHHVGTARSVKESDPHYSGRKDVPGFTAGQ